jgi:hypothetical protein
VGTYLATAGELPLAAVNQLLRCAADRGHRRKDRLALVAPIVAGLGHEVIAREIEVGDVGAVTARERPGAS